MSRGPQGDAIPVKPSVNIYTVLTGVALVAAILALTVIYFKAKVVFGDPGLFG
jgi:hypothetical protein